MTPDRQADHSIPLTRHIVIAVVAPVFLLLVMGSVLAWQISRMATAADLVDRTNVQLAKLFELHTQIVEQESALREYLISGERAVLATFETTAPERDIAELRPLYSDPEQLNRLAELETNLKAWYQLATHATVGDHITARNDLAGLRARVRTLEHARQLLRQSVATARQLLDERSHESTETERGAKIAFVSLLGLSALAIGLVSRRQLTIVSRAFQRLVGTERAARDELAEREWVRRGEAEIAATLVAERGLADVGTHALDALCAHTGAAVGALYHARGDRLVRIASHGVAGDVPDTVSATSGQLGQAVVDGRPRTIAGATAQLAISGGVGVASTVELAIVPARIDGQTIAVVELGYPAAIEARAHALLAGLSTTIAAAVQSAEQRARLRELLEETQRQGEELQTQHEELRVTNEELEHQSQALREASLRQQQIQHELEAANASLEAHTAKLQQQREDLLHAQHDLEEHARELQLASQYKSEFLARMSHELRTPLNSALILARLLGDNPNGNLTEEQVRFANTIYAAGNDLLLLINDILDLAKIEAGRLELRRGTVPMARIRQTLLREFEPVATSRGLSFGVDLAPGTPAQLDSDEQRLMQVLRNLVSNACKFTERGGVSVTIERQGEGVRIAVRDTGIGIPAEHHERVFEAFHQVDGSGSRRHGGTGLGLAISRDLAELLGGDLQLASEPGRGSTFTLVLPPLPPGGATFIAAAPPPARLRARASESPPPATVPVVDPPPPAPATAEQVTLDPGIRTLLVIEDDPAFASILVDLARELGFQAVVGQTADEGVELALRHHPDGILLDVQLPDHSGLSVLERIKRQPSIRHIPIHMVSVADHTQRSLELGAVGYLLKPASRDHLIAAIRRIEDRTSQRVRRLLIVEDDATQAEALARLLGGVGVEISNVGTIREAMQQLSRVTFDCVVMDLRLADGTGFELLERMTTEDTITFPPVIVHTGKALTEEEETRLRHYASSIIVKGARSPERLLDEVTLFLHQVEADLPPERQAILREVRDREAVFDGKRVLIVEDDVRNVFALASTLEPRGLVTLIARNGREALEVLRREDVDFVLMDVMMPEMNGIDATREIRKQARWSRLPIVALTAKAMSDDRVACLDAGANDYLAKPINVDTLLSLMRVWMPR